MEKIKEFGYILLISIVVWGLFSEKENSSTAVDVWAFIFVFYYLYSSGENIFRIKESDSILSKLGSTIALLFATLLGSRILGYIILQAMELIS